MNVLRGSCLFAAVVCLSLVVIATKEEELKHTNIVLIGATGDLARKHLWTSLFDFFSKHYVKGKNVFSIYGCSRKSPTAGREFMSEILLKVIQCPVGDDACKGNKKKFVEAIQFHQLKTEKHYEDLGNKINENIQSIYGLQGSPNSPEIGRLVYLSIPPSAYVKTSKFVHKYLRQLVGRPWFRVVIEKPFGHSYGSAQDLSEKLGQYFTDMELYRMDHYLGKTVVKEILPFRYFNRELYEPIWNRHFIERVEVVMKEKLDVEGRTSFYEEVGVIRDVMQSHLMEMTTQIGMDLPENSGIIRDLLAAKRRFLKSVEPLRDQAVIVGQYASYHNECLNELSHSPDIVNTPTFATSVLSVNNARWRGVPFVLMSGKKMDEKFSYIRVVFKKDAFHIKHTQAKTSALSQVIFHISTSNHLHPSMISVSENLPTVRAKVPWSLETIKGSRFFFGESINDTMQLIPDIVHEAYTSLLDSVYEGARHMFVDTQCLMTAWKIWTPVLQTVAKTRPRIYQGGKTDMDRLDFHVLGTRAVEYIQKDQLFEIPDVQTMDIPEMKQIPGTFRDQRLVTGTTDEVITRLASHIETAATEAVKDRKAFHLALPGGQSPVLLLKQLVSLVSSFPWQDTHIWQVDERCVPQDEPQSNFRLINSHLLEHVPIPYLNIHPMPVHLYCEPCSDTDDGDDIYSAAINRQVLNSTFDFIVLGVGFDGHVASLFPNQSSLDDTEKSVIYSEAGPDKVSPKRMTLTFPMINEARKVGIIILGAKKHDLAVKLSEQQEEDAVKKFPVLGVTSKELTWYIDSDAYFGNLWEINDIEK